MFTYGVQVMGGIMGCVRHQQRLIYFVEGKQHRQRYLMPHGQESVVMQRVGPTKMLPIATSWLTGLSDQPVLRLSIILEGRRGLIERCNAQNSSDQLPKEEWG